MPYATNKREKTLMLLAGFFAAILILYALNQFYGASTARLIKQRNAAIADNNKYSETIEKSARYKKVIEEHVRGSLPITDRVASSARYQNWLIGIVNSSGIQNSGVDVVSIREVAQGKRLNYCIFDFTVKGNGSISQITNFLERFYEVDQRHLISSLSLKPKQDPNSVDLTVEIQVIGLPETPASDEFVVKKKESADFKELTNAIAKRVFFKAYQPPDRPKPVEADRTPPTPPPFDITPFCYVNGIVSAGGVPEAWIHNRPEGKLLHLKEGDRFQLGTVNCLLIKINDRTIDVEAGKNKTIFRIGFGKAFAEAEIIDRPETL